MLDMKGNTLKSTIFSLLCFLASFALYGVTNKIDKATMTYERRDGLAVRFFDGDSIHVHFKGDPKPVMARLYGIDAPEKDQDYGLTASARLRELIKDKPLEFEIRGTDSHKRLLVVVYYNGLNVNLQMLREGLAWHYDRFDGSPDFAAAHQEAKTHKRGLWINSKAISPEEFRHKK